jgi:hypothetical protein
LVTRFFETFGLKSPQEDPCSLIAHQEARIFMKRKSLRGRAVTTQFVYCESIRSLDASILSTALIWAKRSLSQNLAAKKIAFVILNLYMRELSP